MTTDDLECIEDDRARRGNLDEIRDEIRRLNRLLAILMPIEAWEIRDERNRLRAALEQYERPGVVIPAPP